MHLLPGRVRIIAKPMRGNAQVESVVHTSLKRLKGVQTVRTSIVSGAISVRFDAEEISPYRILNALIRLDLIPNVLPINSRHIGRKVHRATPQTNTKQLFLAVASTAVKLALPILLGKYVGRPAARALRLSV